MALSPIEERLRPDFDEENLKHVNKKTRFEPDDPDMVFQGDATPKVGTIDFNLVNFVNRVGWASYVDKVKLWDADSGKLSDFTTRFSFTIDTRGASAYGHGIAFFLVPVGSVIPPNSAGGFLGLFNTTTSYLAQNQIVLVEFDSFSNEEWDPPYQHVGINKNSVASAVNISWNASLHSGDTADARITYNATTNNLSVTWSYSNNSNAEESSSLSYRINLMEVLPEWVMVGFSAATGSNVERHVLESWEFSSSLEVKLANGLSPRDTKLVIGLSVSGGLILIGGVVTLFLILHRRIWRRKEAIERGNLTLMDEDLKRGAGPRMFLRKDLALATNNFSDQRKLGEGGFGAVYRGYLVALDVPVAVKKISRGSRQGKKEYITEVKIISMLRHRNLVQLIGWCHERGEFLLVYEFMPNGSLDAHLFGKKNPLTWVARYKIALGLASGLLYLHEEWEQCVVHRDIKSSNVMLDSSFNAKLGDFGLARLMDHELGPQTTGLAGTLGYLAPEYIATGRASKEADVFSFGIVVLEIGTGRKSSDRIEESPEMGLAEWVWDLYGRGKLISAYDGRLVDSGLEEGQVECLMMVGLWCAHPDHTFRPSIRQAIQVLSFEASVPELPSKMPVPEYRVPAIPLSVSSGQPFETNSSFGVGR